MFSDLAFLSKYKNRKILVTPLNWGLGHATRSLPVIKSLLENNEVVIASDGIALTWLKKNLPGLTHIQLPLCEVKYRLPFMWMNMLQEMPKLFNSIKRENKIVEELVTEQHFDLIISDHRLGCRSMQTESIVIAHQLMIPHKNPLIANLATSVQLRFINRFNECWVPDYQNEPKLSGQLAMKDLDIPKRFIGPISRFEGVKNQNASNDHVLVLLSGPEPSRSKLEENILESLTDWDETKIVLVRGTTQDRMRYEKPISENLKIYDLPDFETLEDLFVRSFLVIARSGYSTLMDLHVLSKPAILIPTPGQPEQEYLANLIPNKNQYIHLRESQINKEYLQQLIRSKLGVI